MHTGKICFIVYYLLPTCFFRYCDHHQDNVTRTLINSAHCYIAQLKTLNVIVNVSGSSYGRKNIGLQTVKSK